MRPPFPWLGVYALRVLIALSIQRGLRAMRSDFLLAFFQRVQFPLSMSPYSLSYRWFGLVWLFGEFGELAVCFTLCAFNHHKKDLLLAVWNVGAINRNEC
jgi:hypothetical protein